MLLQNLMTFCSSYKFKIHWASWQRLLLFVCLYYEWYYSQVFITKKLDTWVSFIIYLTCEYASYQSSAQIKCFILICNLIDCGLHEPVKFDDIRCFFFLFLCTTTAWKFNRLLDIALNLILYLTKLHNRFHRLRILQCAIGRNQFVYYW